jgi:outer membrane protein assembly factor BamA
MIRLREVFCIIFGMCPLASFADHTPEAFGQETCERLAREHPGAVIGAIAIVQRKVLEPSDAVPSWVPMDLVNRLHIITAEHVIRTEVLFEEGDRLDPALIEETRRNLRRLDYFRDESMECTLMEDGKVQVTVRVKETWSIVPIFSVQGVGGKQSITAGLMDKNLMGQGKGLSVAYRSGIESDNTYIENSLRTSYSDPNILGSRFQMSWTVQALETGEYLTATFQRPFFSLETPWAAGGSQWHLRQKRRLIIDGESTGEYDREDNQTDLHVGIALTRGTQGTQRVEALYQYRQKRVSDFKALSARADPGLVPEDYTTSAPGLSYRRLGIHYVREKRMTKFDRYEDFNLANDLTVTAACSIEALGAARDELLFWAYDSQGYAFRQGHFLLARGSLEGQWDGHELRDGTFLLSSDYWLRDTPLDFGPLLHTFHTSLRLGYGVNLTPDNLLELGWDTGLRGYARATFTGNKLLLLTLEDRIFLSEDLFGLVALGAVLFWDAGHVWDEDQGITAGDVRHDVGIGLRIGIPAFSGENILRLDIGFPVGHGSSPGDYVFTMVTSTTI